MNIDHSLCRLCLQRPGCINIFQNDVLPEHIFNATNIKVCSTDTLPSKLCQNCFDIVQLVVSFRELVSRNNRHLHAYLNYQLKRNSRLLMNKSPEAMEIIIKEDNELNKTSNDCKTKTNVITNQSIIKVRKDLYQHQEETPKEESNVAEQISNEKNVENTNLESQEQSQTRTHHSTKRKMMESAEISSHVAPLQKVEIEEEFKPSKIKKNEDGPIFSCEICSKYFETSKKLYLHNRIHNKIHVCQVDGCGKKFATKADLKKHDQTHTGEKPYECNICKNKFAQRVTLRFHKENIHGMTPENLTDEERVSKLLWGD